MNHPEPIVVFADATCAYEKRMVFTHLSLSIPTGMFAGVVGPSGTGKTTLLKAILGLVPVNRGTVTVGGRRIHSGMPQHVGYVPQIEHIDWNFPVTAAQVVAMGLPPTKRLWPGLARQEVIAVHSMLERLEIGKLHDAHISELSGGQLQRVFLARALVRQPKLLLLDEPTNGIDIKTRHALLHLLTDLHHDGMTIILTTHDLNAVAAHLPWIICFHHGIVAQGPPTKVFTGPILSQTYDAPLQVITHTGALGHLPFVAEKDIHSAA